MNCDDVLRNLHRYVDGELRDAGAAAFEAHVRDCAECADAVEDVRVTSDLVRLCAVRYAAPRALKTTVARRERTRRTLGPILAGVVAAVTRANWPALGSLAASLVLATAIVTYGWRPAATDAMPNEVVSAHVRAMMSDRLTELATADDSRARPWLRERLDVMPRVADAVAAGIRLVGSRVDYVAHRTAGALVYAAGNHYVTVFVWPTRDARHGPAVAGTVRGFNLVNWVADGVFYCAVSDMDAAALYRLAQRLGASA